VHGPHFRKNPPPRDPTNLEVNYTHTSAANSLQYPVKRYHLPFHAALLMLEVLLTMLNLQWSRGNRNLTHIVRECLNVPKSTGRINSEGVLPQADCQITPQVLPKLA